MEKLDIDWNSPQEISPTAITMVQFLELIENPSPEKLKNSLDYAYAGGNTSQVRPLQPRQVLPCI